MADTLPPPVLPSSPAAPRSDAAARRSTSTASSSSTALAFLVHSPNTVENNLPPDVDNKPLARQKRRRTSKEDEEVLKAEYLRNPKPDKAARMEIVTKVALGEKEVQVWFQNKRQNDRRRARPSDSKSPDSALMSSSSLSSDPLSPDEDDAAESKTECPEVDATHVQIGDPEPTCTVRSEGPEAQPSNVIAEETTRSESQSTASTTIASSNQHSVETAPTELCSSQHSIAASQESSQPRQSYLANRRSASFVRSQEESFSVPAQPSTQSSSRSLDRAHSFVRLSMTADGKARVVTDADQSPSPPHKRPSAVDFNNGPSLRRSFSAAGLNERAAASSRDESSPKIPRTSIVGRSRDSRTWEFFCDPETRNSHSLTAKAEQEGSGSAADAIGLIRANGRRSSVLGQNQNRRNTPLLSRKDSTGSSVKKARQFRRAETTHGRLQTRDTCTANKSKKLENNSSDEPLPQTESDKENWEPENASTPYPSRRARPNATPSSAPQRTRQILGENTEIMSQSNSFGVMLEREHNAKSNETRSKELESDEELRIFMSGPEGLSARTNLSTGEEMGCVEGLLKLRRGNWR